VPFGDIVKNILRREGVRGLFLGNTNRVMYYAPPLGFYMGTFDYFKPRFEDPPTD